MLHLEIDWPGLAIRTPLWCSLAPATRRAFLEHEMNKPLPAAAVAPDAERLVAARWLQPFNESRFQLHPEFRPFLRALRAMHRHRFPKAADLRGCVSYLQDHFTSAERQQIAATFSTWPRIADELIAQHVTSFDWLQRGLNPEAGRGPFRTGLLGVSDRKDVAKLVRFVAEHDGVLAVSALSAVTGIREDRLPLAVGNTLRHVLLFATLLEKDDAPAFLIWPSALARWKRPPVLAPLTVPAPAEVFHFPILAEDAAAILVSASAEPLRVRAHDFALFEKAAKRVHHALPHLPEWTGAICNGWDSTVRVNHALEYLRELELLSTVGREGLDLRAEPSPIAREWLAKSQVERLRTVLDLTRTLLERDGWGPFYPVGRFAQATRAAFATVPRDRFVALGDFLEYQATQNNPLHDATGRGYFNYSLDTAEQREAAWRDHLGRFFVNQLVPLDGVAYGTLPDQRFAFTLTPAGRYLLGLDQTLEMTVATTAAGIIVQPNFDIVFLAPAPAVEAGIARFAYRVGAGGVGTLFRLTPETVRNAVAAGLSAENMLDQLREHATRTIPANVERELRGWSDACRRVEIAPALLLRCPDEQTASQVLATAGAFGRLIGPTTVELTDPKQRATLEKKLRTRGIFLETSPAMQTRRRPARR